MVDDLGVDQLHDLRQILVEVGDLGLLRVDENPEMLADQLNRPGGGTVTGTYHDDRVVRPTLSQGRACRCGIGFRRLGHLERGFPGSRAHPVGARYQFVAAQPEPAIDQEKVFSFRYNHIIALPQIADDILNQSRSAGIGCRFGSAHFFHNQSHGFGGSRLSLIEYRAWISCWRLRGQHNWASRRRVDMHTSPKKFISRAGHFEGFFQRCRFQRLGEQPAAVKDLFAKSVAVHTQSLNFKSAETSNHRGLALGGVTFESYVKLGRAVSSTGATPQFFEAGPHCNNVIPSCGSGQLIVGCSAGLQCPVSNGVGVTAR
jgi:hypothetical protein